MKKKNNLGTEPNKGYVDGIKAFYEEDEIPGLLVEVAQLKDFSEDDPLAGRAYLLKKSLADAEPGTVLRPAINLKTGNPTSNKWKGYYNYASTFAGRNSFLHSEIVERKKDWFKRIN